VRLTKIDDLLDPHNDWKPLLEHVASIQTILEHYKRVHRDRRKFEVFMTGNEDRAPGLHASEICSCLRQATYSLLGTKKKADTENVDINMLMRFDIGTSVHSLLQNEFKLMCAYTNGQLSFEDEVRINRDTHPLAAQYDLSSSCDGIFTFKNADGTPYMRVGLEIKTMSDGEYSKSNQPKEYHTLQGTFYQKLLDLPLIWYLYYNKSNSNYTPPRTPWLVPFNTNTWNRLEDRAQQAHRHVQAGTLPEREEGMPCRWCGYATECMPATLKSRGEAPKVRQLTPIRRS
jgi:CRISPR/Cas system-associated exonuclease Cas4 (RecB family)